MKMKLMVESSLQIITERRSDKFYKPLDVHYVSNAVGDWRKHDVPWGNNFN